MTSAPCLEATLAAGRDFLWRGYILNPEEHCIALIVGAVVLDQLIGDPQWLLHPVVVMGWWIQRLRLFAEHWAGDHPHRLRLGGGVLTLILVLGTGGIGWCLERLIWLPFPWPWVGSIVLTVGLASSLAARSLAERVGSVLDALTNNSDQELGPARERLAWIVGRDVERLNETGILRAAAETASENAVDGIFAPFFWMAIGLLVWTVFPAGPGPLSLAWVFKASSTIDSMLGYKHGRLRWLGSAGARLDDALTWLPCRLVMLTLPLVSCTCREWSNLVIAAERDGASDPSPNAGRSIAIYAHCAKVRLGGGNWYAQGWVDKPILGAKHPVIDKNGVRRILKLSFRLQCLWLTAFVLVKLTQ